jgi:outer membrane usher protein
VAGDEDAASLATNFAAQFNRGDLGFDNSTQYNFDQSEVTSSQSSLQAGFAIATAGGKVALGRPINDSFMIVSAHRGVGDAPIEVDRTEEGFAARTDWLGPALLSNLSSYNPRAITAVTEAASAGMSLDDSSFRVRPTYRSGYAVTVGSEYTITATGRLVDAQGQPVGLVRGVAKLADGSDEKREVEFFSNARGQFALLGLKPGVWRLTTTGAAPRTFEITVPDDASGLVRLNDVGEAR